MKRPSSRRCRPTIDELAAAAQAARRRAYAPYSNYRVGAALETVGGRIVTGGNVENVSYGLTVCAERAALTRAVAEGERRFRRIAITANPDKMPTPCGACRQVLAEFCPNIEVVIVHNGRRTRARLTKLLPLRFKGSGRP